MYWAYCCNSLPPVMARKRSIDVAVARSPVPMLTDCPPQQCPPLLSDLPHVHPNQAERIRLCSIRQQILPMLTHAFCFHCCRVFLSLSLSPWNQTERVREYLRQELGHPRRAFGNLRRVEGRASHAGLHEDRAAGFHAGYVGMSRGSGTAAHLRDALQTGKERVRAIVR